MADCDSGSDAFQEVVNEMSFPMTVRWLSAPILSVAADVTEDDTVNDEANIQIL